MARAQNNMWIIGFCKRGLVGKLDARDIVGIVTNADYTAKRVPDMRFAQSMAAFGGFKRFAI